MRNDLVMQWDELNILRDSAVDMIRSQKKRRDEHELDRWCDYMDFVLCLMYDYGWKDAEEIVGIVPFKDGLDDKTVNLDIEGETFRNRIHKQVDAGSLEGVLRIIDTEAHRDYNTGVYDAAIKSGAKGLRKRWETMQDGRVRDTHDYLQSMEVGLDDRFYTYDGDSARFPGDFSLASNNANCRCWVTLVK